ncbi:MAG TPA: glycerol-3-phosphate dehydrogenase/oxidase, partial [Candidatus Synoicihabitans sp.]|nr:glycerol-3-phosphate dehydrogenase/oxidase [Candidatus Synoicihabitans sp.]
EASVEKKTIRAIAPHLAEPLGFVFPAYRKTGRPLWQLRVGVKIYDLLCGGRNFQPSRGFTREETLLSLPSLNPDGLLGSVRYFDALTNDARLVIDTLRSAAAHDAAVCNHLRFHNAYRAGDAWHCELEDQLAGETFTVHARTIVNATGPWAQQVPHSSVNLRLSKGIHVVVDRRLLPVSEAVVITEGKRILFLIPWGERVIVGTTDTDYHADPEQVRVEPSDVAYVLRTVNEFIPHLRLRENDIISSWAGLRPLIANPDGSPSDISRAHQIVSPEPGWWDVAGGKLTTYRLMAEQTVDQLGRFLRVSTRRCRTAAEPLLDPSLAAGYSGIVPPVFSREAVLHYVGHEWALHLDDVMLRRSSWHYYHMDAPRLAKQTATWMAELLGWSDAQRERELAAYRLATGRDVTATQSAPLRGAGVEP